MKVSELLAKLNDLPVEALEKDIFLGIENEELAPVAIEPIVESCDDKTIIGYVLCEDKQLKLPFDEEEN